MTGEQLAIGVLGRRSAKLDPTRRYRYRLTRAWGIGTQPRVCWIMLNPSTADALQDDATIRRCVDFSKAWGFASLVVVNLFAWRATRPSEIYTAEDPVGSDNDVEISIASSSSQLVVAAWGNHGGARGRAIEVRSLLGRTCAGVRLAHLGLTKKGEPKHPLYLPRNQKPVDWGQA